MPNPIWARPRRRAYRRGRLDRRMRLGLAPNSHLFFMEKMVPPDRIELSTSALPRMRSTTELRRHSPGWYRFGQEMKRPPHPGRRGEGAPIALLQSESQGRRSQCGGGDARSATVNSPRASVDHAGARRKRQNVGAAGMAAGQGIDLAAAARPKLAPRPHRERQPDQHNGDQHQGGGLGKDGDSGCGRVHRI